MGEITVYPTSLLNLLIKKKKKIYLLFSTGLPPYVRARQIALEAYASIFPTPPPPPPVTFDDLSFTHSAEVSLIFEFRDMSILN